MRRPFPNNPASVGLIEEQLKVNALSELLNLPDSEKKTRGLVHTPAEIAQQSGTRQSTFDLFKNQSGTDIEHQQARQVASRAAVISKISRRVGADQPLPQSVLAMRMR